ncbi:hypothetical protein PG990_003298 [Apiospora arundinis]
MLNGVPSTAAKGGRTRWHGHASPDGSHEDLVAVYHRAQDGAHFPHETSARHFRTSRWTDSDPQDRHLCPLSEYLCE